MKDILSERKIIRNRWTHLIIGVVLIVKISLHIISDFISGYLGDEFLHIDAGKNLALGYTDFPPMIGLIAWIQNLFQSESIIVNRIFVHLAGVAMMLISAKIIIKLGGKEKALIIGMLAFFISPLIWVSHTLFLPTGFNQFFHVLSVYFLFLYYHDRNDRYLYLVALFVGLGVLTKYSIGVFIISIAIVIVMCDRAILKKKSFWISVLIFLAIISPNLLWQVQNDLPIISHFIALSAMDLDQTSFRDTLLMLITFMNPLTFIVSLVGIILLIFASRLKRFRIIGLTLLLTIILIFTANGKFYYVMPVMIAAISFGGFIIGKWLENRKWLFIFIAIFMIVSGIRIVPMGMPLTSPDKYVEMYGVQPTDDGRTPIFFDHFHTQDIWPDVVKCVNDGYHGLSEEEQQSCMIWGRHYSHAGLINLYKDEYQLPKAISLKGCYQDWLPNFDKGKLCIAIGEYNLDRDYWLKYFDAVEEIGSYRDMFSKDYQNSGIRIFMCRHLKYTSEELKSQINKYGIFDE